MRLCRYDNDQLGVVIGDQVHDVTAAGLSPGELLAVTSPSLSFSTRRWLVAKAATWARCVTTITWAVWLSRDSRRLLGNRKLAGVLRSLRRASHPRNHPRNHRHSN